MLSGTLSCWLVAGSCVGRRCVGRVAVGSCALLMVVVVVGGCKSSSGWVSYRSGVVYGPSASCATRSTTVYYHSSSIRRHVHERGYHQHHHQQRQHQQHGHRSGGGRADSGDTRSGGGGHGTAHPAFSSPHGGRSYRR